ncbi:MAG: DNA ligase D [Pseudozobellia sp.]|mgnify:CR=1 FL=1|nr:DNA ligase D [Pseudozobellia sp.]MBG48013.1 DNA ligase D [Pseudozobellia sp.]
MSLEEYNSKREFSTTSEPIGKISPIGGNNRFVIQRHSSRKLHYDLRLEIDGVLKSWAIPKGPSLNPADKRLAVRTEDHPVSYLNFEGTIPKGNYGAGEMEIWDFGIYTVDGMNNVSEILISLKQGNLKLFFNGQNIKGNYSLVRTGWKSGKEQWLMIKKKDEFAVNGLYDAESFTDGTENFTYPKNLRPGLILSPMLATVRDKVFNDPNWIYELKWDGYRLIAHISDKGVLLQSRNGVSYNSKFPVLVDELKSLDNDVILDGEVVILNEQGISQFGELHNYPDYGGILRYYVFDMIYLNGHSMLNLPLLDRKSLIPNVLEDLSITRFCDHIEGMGTTLLEMAKKSGMEGIIAKEIHSHYAIGTRSENWLKIKLSNSIDAIICGYVVADQGETFSSIILGTKEANGNLIYIGNCGVGFGSDLKYDLKRIMSSFETLNSPFKSSIKLKGKKVIWLRPKLVCEVNFREKTKNNLLRQPVFKRVVNWEEPVIDSIDHDNSLINRDERIPRRGSIKEYVDVDGFRVPISNLDKILWKESKKSKYHLIDYYLSISDYIIPYLKDRPQSLHRFPEGIENEGFYQKDVDFLPEWAESLNIYSKSSDREINYLLCQNAATLLYMANLGCIEINPWNSRKYSLEKPDYAIIDLDPPVTKSFSDIIRVTKVLAELLNELQLKSYYKLSGSKGIHVYIPMGAEYTYEEVRDFIKLICIVVEKRLPELTTLQRTIKKRNGKIYLDYLQNRRGQTVASTYSIRPLPKAPISTPFLLEELGHIDSAQYFTLNDIQQRILDMGDVFSPMLFEKSNLEDSLEELEKLL